MPSTHWTIWLPTVIGLAEILLLLVAVYLTVYQFRRSRASSYIERFNSTDMLESRIAVDRWLHENTTPSARLSALASDPELVTQLRQFANLFQELGAAYQFRIVHRKTVRVLFDSLVAMYWEQLRFWVHEYRARTDPSLYSRFEYLYREMQPRLTRTGTRTRYVVGYGSLMDPASVAAALGREVEEGELIVVSLGGYRRSWNVGERVRVGASESSSVAAFLNLTPDSGAELRAVIFRVREPELRRLMRREKNYEPVDVTADIRLSGGYPVERNAEVWCFVGRPEHRLGLTREEEGLMILERYLERVTTAAAAIDAALATELAESARASGLEIRPGEYCFVNAAQAALV